MITFFYAILGCIARTVWGGWEPLKPYFIFNKASKIICLYSLTWLLGFFVNQEAYILDRILFAFIYLTVAASIHMAQGHGRAQAMGKWNPNGELPLGVCIAIFLGNYAIAMGIVGMAYNIIFHAQAGYIYALIGLLCWAPHWVAQYVWEPLRVKFGINYKPVGQGYFLDSATRIGEAGLGILIFGGLPLSIWIAFIL